MPGAFASPARRWLLVAAALVVGVSVSGCRKSAEISRYRVPKEKKPPPQAAVDAEEAAKKPGQDRMLAAIVPHGPSAWFFKLAGPADAVGEHVEAFEALVESVTFPESADGKPEWKLPEGWEEKPGSQFRFATLEIPAEPKPLEVSVATLPWRSEGESEQILANVNRWRGQMSLPPLRLSEMNGETRTVKLADGEAILVDLKGTLATGG